MTRTTVASLLCGLLFSIPAVPQQTQPKGSQPPIPPVQAAPEQGKTPGLLVKTSPTEIIVPVTVTDDKGRYLSNLEERDFRIMDEGRIQKTTFFYHDSPGVRQHTVIGFLVDLSSSNRSHWDKFQDATKEMILGLMPYDPNYTGYLIGYSTTA